MSDDMNKPKVAGKWPRNDWIPPRDVRRWELWIGTIVGAVLGYIVALVTYGY